MKRKKKDIVEATFFDFHGLMEKVWRDIEKSIKEFWERRWDIFCSLELDIDDFRKKVEEYAKKYPDAKISAWAFVFDGSKSKKPKSWKFEKD